MRTLVNALRSVLLLGTVITGLVPSAVWGQHLEDVAARCRGAVGQVEWWLAKGEEGTGTAFLIDDGVVATNIHVAAHGITKLIRFPDGAIARPVAVRYANADLDWVEIEVTWKGRGQGSAPLPISQRPLSQGESLIVIGAPLGLEGTLSTGILSAIRLSGEKPRLQITAEIAPGSSGSPVINAQGELIGMAVSGIVGPSSRRFGFASPVPAMAGRQNVGVLEPTVRYEDWAREVVTPIEREYAEEMVAGLRAGVVSRLLANTPEILRGDRNYDAYSRLRGFPRGALEKDGEEWVLRIPEFSDRAAYRGLFKPGEARKLRSEIRSLLPIDPFNVDAARLLLVIPEADHEATNEADAEAYEQIVRVDPGDTFAAFRYAELRNNDPESCADLGSEKFHAILTALDKLSETEEERAEFLAKFDKHELWRINARHQFMVETLGLLDSIQDADSRWGEVPDWYVEKARVLEGLAVRRGSFRVGSGVLSEVSLRTPDIALLEDSLLLYRRAQELGVLGLASSNKEGGHPSNYGVLYDKAIPGVLELLGRASEGAEWYRGAVLRVDESTEKWLVRPYLRGFMLAAVELRRRAVYYGLENGLQGEAEYHLVFLEELADGLVESKSPVGRAAKAVAVELRQRYEAIREGSR